jgi:hypothetical protein
MTRQRFVRPDTTRLALSDDDWIEIHTELAYGELQELRRAAMRPISLAGAAGNGEVKMELDPFALQQRQLELYLIDWSFRDEQDKPVPCDRQAIALLDMETADEITAAIGRHEEELKAKKMTGGARK